MGKQDFAPVRLIQQTYNGNTNTANGYQNHYQLVDSPPYVRAKLFEIRAKFSEICAKPSNSLFMIGSKLSNSLFITRLKSIDSSHIFDKKCFVFGFHGFHLCLYILLKRINFTFQVVIIVRHIGVISWEDEKGE